MMLSRRSNREQDVKDTLGAPSWPLVLTGAAVLIVTAAGVYWAARSGTVVTEKTVPGTKTTTTKAVPSDTLLGVGLALGGLLVLSGALWSKIKTIKAAGIEVSLDSDEVGQGKDAVAAAAKSQGKTEPEVVATATARALPKLRRLKAEKGELDTEDFLNVAAQAVQNVETLVPEMRER